MLLAEDDPPSRLFLAEALRSLGFSVRACTTGAEALELARRQRFDVLLLDRNLPPPNGECILRELRADTSSASHQACALASSADQSACNERSAIAAGFVALLGKPCSIKQLRNTLHQHCPCATLPLADDVHALSAAGNKANLVALRRLLVRELEQIASGLKTWTQDAEKCTAGLHRLVASAAFCGAPALGTAAATLRQQMLEKQDHSAAQAQFENVLRATLRHFRALT